MTRTSESWTAPAVRGPRRAAAPAVTVCLLVLLTSPVLAQEQGGGIRGWVYDQGFQVPRARVRVSIVGLPLGTTTRDDGSFVFEDVRPGSYTLTFQKDGFEREVLPGVVVSAGESATRSYSRRSPATSWCPSRDGSTSMASP